MWRANVDLENVDFLPELAEFIKDKGWSARKIFRANLARVENHGEGEERGYCSLEYILTQKIEKLASRYPGLKGIFGDMRVSRILGHLSRAIEKDYQGYVPNFYYCEAASTGVYVFGADGFLYPCSEVAGDPSLSIGRFVPHLEIDEEKFNCWRDQSVLEISECVQCPVALLCGGGCRYEAMRISKKSREQLCSVRKKQVEDYIKLRGRDLLTRPHSGVR